MQNLSQWYLNCVQSCGMWGEGGGGEGEEIMGDAGKGEGRGEGKGEGGGKGGGGEMGERGRACWFLSKKYVRMLAVVDKQNLFAGCY